VECKKAIFNKFFLMVIVIGCIITLFSFFPRVQTYYHDMALDARLSAEQDVVYNSYAPMESLFAYWIGDDSMTSGSVLYFFLFPLLIAIPFGWSYCSERRSGYIKNMVIRAGRTKYHLSKYIALFLSGGLAMVMPLLFNFLLTAMFVPAVLPDVSYITGYGIGANSLFSMLFYTHPFAYVFTYLAVDFVFCGLLACLCFAVSSFIKNRVIVVLLPFFILLGFHYFCYSFIYTSMSIVYSELSPMHFLRPVPAAYDTNWIIVTVEIAILFIVTFFATVVRWRRHEIY
jgi:ABC-type transport system involved in multi-copper enzyme maturation permease subunit